MSERILGKPVAGPSGNVGRKPMSEEGKAAIKAGLERARAAKQSGMASAGGSAPIQKPVAVPAPVMSQTAGTNTPPKNVASEKATAGR